MPTKIEWTDETWNPITGCTAISEGCKNCYARRMAQRLKGRFGYPEDEPFRVTFHPDRLNQPFKWKKPRMIFVCSMGDLFHKDVKVSQLNMIFTVISISWELDLGHKFLILTKRPKKMKKYIEEHGNYETAICSYDTSNVWLGVTAENQKRADERIPILLQILTKVRFVSVEPMLEEIDIDDVRNHYDYATGEIDKPFIDWVIAGPETGPGKRECKPEWIRHLCEQTHAAGLPFFDKTKKNWIARKFPK